MTTSKPSAELAEAEQVVRQLIDDGFVGARVGKILNKMVATLHICAEAMNNHLCKISVERLDQLEQAERDLAALRSAAPTAKEWENRPACSFPEMAPAAPAGADAVREALLIENAPEALKQLGSRLADLLDADHWNNIEPLLLDLAAASAMSVELERSPAKLVERERIEQILRVHFWMGEPGQPAAIKVATAAILALIEQPARDAGDSANELLRDKTTGE